MYCSRLFVVVFQEINCLHTYKHAYVRWVTELHLSTKFVSAAVSKIRVLKEKKEKKKNSEIDYFQFNTFPGHIIYPFFNQRYLLSTCTVVRSPLHHKLKVIIKISLSTL